MIRSYQFVFWVLIALWLQSCSQSKMLQRNLRKYPSSLQYLHDSPITACPKQDSVMVNLYIASIDSLTSVKKINKTILPFIVFNYSEINLKVLLGESNMDPTFDDFFLNSFFVESQRTGCFAISDKDQDDSLYTLDITVDTCVTEARYQRSVIVLYLFIAASSSASERGFPAKTHLKISTRLRKGPVTIAEKSYRVSREQPYLRRQSRNVQDLRADFSANMVESLSLATKKCLEDIITDVNAAIQKK